MTPPEIKAAPDWSWLRWIATTISLIAHGLLAWLIFSFTIDVGEPMEAQKVLMLEFASVPPPPPPPPPQVKPPKPVSPTKPRDAAHHADKPKTAEPKPALTHAPLKTQTPTTSVPPQHFFGAHDDSHGTSQEDGEAARNDSLGGTPASVHMSAPPDYAEIVKAKIIAAKVYPQDAQQKQQQCKVAYQVNIDKRGNIASYEIEPCPVDSLNTATRNAILKAAPFPPPPDFTGSFFELYGSLIFRL